LKYAEISLNDIDSLKYDTVNKEKRLIFPFAIEFSETSTRVSDGIDHGHEDSAAGDYRIAKFKIKTQTYFKDKHNPQIESRNTKSSVFQFNIRAQDQAGFSDTSTIQVTLINKQQRVKLVFSQPLDAVLGFQEEFQSYISNVTGFKANIDKISLHRSDDDEEYEETSTDASKSKPALTDMLLHFMRQDKLNTSVDASNQSIEILKPNIELHLKEGNDFIVNADTILKILDRSKESQLLTKYKLSLAEKYDDQGASTYYKYGSVVDEDFGSFFQWTPNSKQIKGYMSRFLLITACVALILILTIILIVCFCMRQKFKRKLKAERAMVKAFGLERSLTYNDVMSGYINSGFDSNSLLPIPGTNLYAYEGSNPMWLKKYDKIANKNQSSSTASTASSTTSPASDGSGVCFSASVLKAKEPQYAKSSSLKIKNKNNSNSNSNTGNNNNSEDISSFYLKQIDSAPGTSKCSPISIINNPEKVNINKTLTSEIITIHNTSPISISNNRIQMTANEPEEKSIEESVISKREKITNEIITEKIERNLNSFKSETLLTFASSNSASLSKASNRRAQIYNNETHCLNKPILFQNNFTKIFDSEHVEQSFIRLKQQVTKDYCDLFAVESTVI
jgi:hypothetical protein